MTDDLELAFLGAHRDPTAAGETLDAVRVLRERRLPRHRARRPAWKPPVAEAALEPVHAQHADDREPLVR